MVGASQRGWVERYQGVLVALAILVLAAVIGLGLAGLDDEREARVRDQERLSELLNRQTEALERQSAVLIEQARLEYQPALRILAPQPFETVGGQALTRFATENADGSARDAELRVVLLCCAHLDSLAAKPESAVLYPFASPERLALLSAGETLRQEVTFAASDHPARVTAREPTSHKLSAWAEVSYREPLALGDGEPGRRTQTASFLWDGALWRWMPATGDEHRSIEAILRARGALDGGAAADPDEG